MSGDRVRARGRPMPVAFCLTKRAVADQHPDANEVCAWVTRINRGWRKRPLKMRPG